MLTYIIYAYHIKHIIYNYTKYICILYRLLSLPLHTIKHACDLMSLQITLVTIKIIKHFINGSSLINQ